jgi:D-proline reductase (dithiol) PrdB
MEGNMPRIEDLDPDSQEFIQNYQCVPGVDLPWTPLAKPLDQCKVALVTSSGLIRRSDKPFDLSNPGGDPSFRIIPSDTDPSELTLSIVSTNWDRSGFAADVNTTFPMDRLRELAEDGHIGEVAAEHYAFMGSIFEIGPVMNQSAPEVGRRLKQAGVDVAFLVPV